MAGKKKTAEEIAAEAKAEAGELADTAAEVEDAADDAEDPALENQAASVARSAGEIQQRAKVAQIQAVSESTAQAMLEEIRTLKKQLADGVKASSLSDLFDVFGLGK